MNTNLNIIIPVHQFNDSIATYLDKAIESITKQSGNELKPNLTIVYPTDIDKGFAKYAKKINKTFVQDSNINSIKLLLNENSSDFQSQVNFAVNNIETEYFTVLEYDDELSNTFVKNYEKFAKSYPDVDIFPTLMIEVDENNNGMKLTNEISWAQQFAGENGECGYLNIDGLKQYTDFKLSGAIFKKQEFLNIGGYKSNIRLSFGYELMLRALNNGLKVYTIPKIGYKHLAVREGSMTDVYLKNMAVNERKFWFETALKESNFTNDRLIDVSKVSGAVVEK